MSHGEQAFLWETPPELWRGVKSEQASGQGRVASIYIAPRAAGPMISIDQVRAFADRGLEGDRFYRESWTAANRPDKAVTFVEEETLELAAAELGTTLLAGKTRRNIVTRGVALIDLLHREFMVGGVRMRGLRLFEPCAHLEKVSQLPGIFRALEHRSGLKASILSDGVIRTGDGITVERLKQASAS